MNEAKLLVSRDVAIDLPAGPSEVVVVLGRGGDREIAELELAAQAEHGADAVCEIVDGDDLERALAEVERRAPEHVVLLGEAVALAGRIRNAGAVFVGDSSPVASGDYATGGNHVLPTNGWARSVGGLGLETFLKPVTLQRLTAAGPRARAADRRGARGDREHARARTGGRAVRQLAPSFRPYEWAPSTDELARRAGLDPVEIVRFDGNVPPLPLPSSRPGAIAAALADVNTYPHGGYPGIHEAIAAYAGVEPENVVLGAGGDDLILLCARAFAGPGDVVSVPPEPDVSALPRRGRARRRDGRRRRARPDVLLPPGQPARRLPAAAGGATARRRRGVLRVRRRDARCRSSTTA